ncbi:ankyrin repeat-containing domain protein [Aspergillus karnatakaensis]|uniref:ankyrin repeat-containing domain protein n=1 Tax=Aspergillus karnatakaensis TaxID=1810916 RepID=UPI003CCD1A4C
MNPLSTEPPTDPIERRRWQSRIAQRRFRQKKKLEQKNKGDSGHTGQPTRTGSQAQTKPPADTPLESTIPATFSLAWNADIFDDAALNLGVLDDILNSSNPSDTLLNETLFSSRFESSGSSTSTSDVPMGNSSLPPQKSIPHTGPEAPSNSADPVSGVASQNPPNTDTENNKGWLNSIHIAAQKGHERVLRVLLERGNLDINSIDSDNRTALFHAAVGGHNNVIRLLLSHGANIAHLDNDYRSVLHWTTHYQRLEVLQTLLEQWPENELGSYINAHDGHGWTPLHLAVERGFEEGLLLLVQYGGDISMRARKCWLTNRVIPFDLNHLLAQDPVLGKSCSWS